MVKDTIKTTYVQQEVVIEDIDYVEIIEHNIYVIYNNNGPLGYCISKEEAIQYSQNMKNSKSPVRYKKVNKK